MSATGKWRSPLWPLRWVIVALAFAVAAVLLGRGAVLLGGLIGAMALLRLVYLVDVARRRRVRRGGRERRSQPVGAAASRTFFRSLARTEFAVAARAMGAAPEEVRQDFLRGRSLAEMATGRGVPVGSVVAAIVGDVLAQVDRGITEGTLSTDGALQIREDAPAWAGLLVARHRVDMLSTRAWRRPA